MARHGKRMAHYNKSIENCSVVIEHPDSARGLQPEIPRYKAGTVATR